jgi:predicted transcriptional regulator
MTQPAFAAAEIETDGQLQDRLAREAHGIALAEAELDAGLHVDPADLRAWIDSLRSSARLPPPPTRST